MILTAEQRSRLEQLALRTRHRVRGRWWGSHRSSRYGDSIDFADYRPYSEGDDIRRVDQHLYARLGVLAVRLFEAEDESPLRLVVDRSASMSIGEKWPTALAAAGVLGFLALASGDRVQAYATPGGGGRHHDPAPPMRQAASWPRLEAWLEGIEPSGVAPLSQAVRGVAGGAPGPVVLISDLMDAEWEATLDRLSLGRGGIVVQVLDQVELAPDLAGDVELVDVETGRRIDVSLDPGVVEAYQGRLDRFLAASEERARRRGLDHLLVPAGPDLADRLIADLAGRGVVR